MQSPYKGLTPYTEEDAPFFFGRTLWSEILSDNLRAHRLTLLYGESGVGKSSVLRAGVAHRLGRPNACRSAAVVVFSAWRQDAEAALVRALDAVAPAGEKGPATLEAAVERCAERVGGRVMLILDQFEEYFLYHQAANGDGFGSALPAALDRDDLPLSVMIGIREDALARLDRFQDSIPSLFDNFLRLEHLDREAAREAIEGPLRRFNADRPAEPDVTIEPALVEAVLDEVEAGKVDLGDAAGGRLTRADGRVETPYLQLVLERLWQEERRAGSEVLRLSTLESLDGAQGIVGSHLGEAMSALGADERDAAAAALRYLVTSSRTKVAHSVADLADWTDVPADRLERVLERLSDSDARILRPVGDGGSYEIRHDVLADAVLAWRAGHDAERRVAEQRAAQRRRLQRIAQRLAFVAIPLLVVVVLYVLDQRDAALDAGRLARQQEKVAESRELAAGAVGAGRTDYDLALLLGLESWKRAHTNEALAALRLGLGRSRSGLQFGSGGEGISRADYNADGTRILTLGDDGVRLWDAARRTPLATLSKNPEASSAFSADGTRVEGSDGRRFAIWDARTGRRRPLQADPGEDAAVSPDGRFVAAMRRGVPTVWSLAGGRVVHRLPRARTVYSVTFSSDGRRLIGEGMETVTVWSLASERRLRTARGHYFSPAISPDARRVFTRRRDGGLDLVDVASGRRVAPGRAGRVGWAVFSPDSRRVVQLHDRGAALRDARTGERLAVAPGSRGRLAGAVFDPDGRRVALVYADASIRVWDPATGTLAHVRGRSRAGAASHLSFSRDGRYLLTSAYDSAPTLWDLSSAQTPTLPTSGARVPGAAFALDGTLLAAAGQDGATRLWSPATGRPIAVLRAGRATVLQVAASGSQLLTMSADGRARLWDLGRRAVVAEMAAGAGKLPAGAFSPDGRLIATATRAGGVRVWRTGDTAPRLRLDTGGSLARSVAFSPDGERLVVGRDDNAVTIWDLRSGRRLATRRATRRFDLGEGFVPHPGARLSPDGTRVLMLGSDGALRVWDQRGRLLAEHQAPGGELFNSAAFSPDGRLIAVGSDDSRIHLYDGHTAAGVATLRGTGEIGQVAFSPDGAVIGGADSDGLVRVWDVGAREQIFSARARGELLLSLAFSPDGQRLLALGSQGPAQVIRCDACVPRSAVVERARASVRRELTGAERREYLEHAQ